jgi:hypothetical protein
VTLNPGDEQFFDVLVECNGKFCPDGIVAVPTYEAATSSHSFVTRVEAGKTVTPTEMSVRASGNGVRGATASFEISRSAEGTILLNAK